MSDTPKEWCPACQGWVLLQINSTICAECACDTGVRLNEFVSACCGAHLKKPRYDLGFDWYECVECGNDDAEIVEVRE